MPVSSQIFGPDQAAHRIPANLDQDPSRADRSNIGQQLNEPAKAVMSPLESRTLSVEQRNTLWTENETWQCRRKSRAGLASNGRQTPGPGKRETGDVARIDPVRPDSGTYGPKNTACDRRKWQNPGRRPGVSVLVVFAVPDQRANFVPSISRLPLAVLRKTLPGLKLPLPFTPLISDVFMA